MRRFSGPPMATAAEVRVQQARETVYDTRWARHRDQALVVITAVVILALVGATVLTGNPMFAALALGAPGIAATFRAVQNHLATSATLRPLDAGGTDAEEPPTMIGPGRP